MKNMFCKNPLKTFVSVAASLVLLVSISSCVKDKYDAPPDSKNVDPAGVSANTTIATLKTKWIPGQLTTITDDFIISGVINADDKSGNYYKVISLEDATGGIQIKVDASYLYNDYPVGRRVFVKCKGLIISDYSGLIQLGGYRDSSGAQPALGGIPYALLPTTVIKGKWGIQLTPQDISIGQLKTGQYQSMLVKLSGTQFAIGDTGKIYADVVYKNSMNRTVTDCYGSSCLLRSSGYSNFANLLTASGGGSITAVASYYSFSASFDPNGIQLVIRDLNDVNFSGPRCGAGGGGLLGLRQLYNSGTTTVPTATTIKGVVISDRANGNINTKSLVVQDSTGGIVLYFNSAHSFNLNDIVTVDVSGLTMVPSLGVLEITGVPVANATVTGTGSITPKVVTTLQASGNYPQNESTLIKITGVTLTGGGGKYYASGSGTNINATDAQSTILMRTLSSATFGTQSYPTTTVSVTGIVSGYNGTPQLTIRNTTDVQ